MTNLSLLLGSIDPFLLWFQPVHGRDVFMPGVKILLEIHLFLGAFLNLTFLLKVPLAPSLWHFLPNVLLASLGVIHHLGMSVGV